MSRRLDYRLWLGPRRQLRSRLPLSQSSLRHASGNAKRSVLESLTKPTPSQLLRFALTGSTQPVQNGVLPKTSQDRHLEELFSEQWPLNTSPPPPLWSSLQQRTAAPCKTEVLRGMEKDIQNLNHLRSLIERNVNDPLGGMILQTGHCRFLAQALKRCQRSDSYGEILSAINGILMRLEKLRAPVSPSLFVLGMYYSCLAFSASALKRYLEGYISLRPPRLDLDSCAPLVDALLVSLQLLPFQEPGYDSSEMRSVVTGESADGCFSEHNLHSIMCWADYRDSTHSVGPYLSLLARLQSDRTLQDIWDRMTKRLRPESPHTFHSAYGCVKALVDVGNHRKAVTYLRQISKCANGNLPSLSDFEGLKGLLAAERVAHAIPQLAGKEYPSILEAQLEDMEKRLGITWNRRKSVHTSISDPLYISSNQPILTVDGDSAGYGSNMRLIAEIEALGCSKSMLELGRVANLLDEFEGDHIRVFIPNEDAAPYDFAWFPQRSPIELPNDSLSVGIDRNEAWSPSTLGLLRVRPHRHGVSLVTENCLHLMQLGYLVARPKSAQGPFLEAAQSWEETGHIVTWDRAFGRFIVVFVGKSREPLDAEKQLFAPNLSFGLDPVMRVCPGKDLPGQKDSTPQFGHSYSMYCVDADPGPDLVFETTS
ncbi:hypothetical protein BDV30DRAFT_202544 [Aspergillus minisclerotigenes]|uniref:Uncharacterized protein n=1 Tax=Aspergillus minisclerotigenes TaxID=656917 RepID=A0A5N6JNH8_9EURO|nr:hypothetical protein BDV30DRAFT_202544 [Aspergillus minisclerotigenes]